MQNLYNTFRVLHRKQNIFEVQIYQNMHSLQNTEVDFHILLLEQMLVNDIFH